MGFSGEFLWGGGWLVGEMGVCILDKKNKNQNNDTDRDLLMYNCDLVVLAFNRALASCSKKDSGIG
jgi:hypothetical protein